MTAEVLCISAAGVGGLTSTERTMDARPYCDILQKIMFKSLKERGRHSIFQYDNDPKHTSKMIKFYQIKR